MKHPNNHITLDQMKRAADRLGHTSSNQAHEADASTPSNPPGHADGPTGEARHRPLAGESIPKKCCTRVATSRPGSSRDLLPSELIIAATMDSVQFGRIESLQVRKGECVLDPYPIVLREFTFGCPAGGTPRAVPIDLALPRELAEFFEIVRCLNSGVIRALEIRRGLPVAMLVSEEVPAWVM